MTESSLILNPEHHGADVRLWDDFLTPAEASALLDELTTAVPWRQEPIRLFGRQVMQPRLTAWLGDPGTTYSYSGLRHEPQPWPAAVAALRRRVEMFLDRRFNSALLNLYRDGNDAMGWHADNEPELGPAPVIASVSLGAARTFRLKPRPRSPFGQHAPVAVVLPGHSLLLMAGDTQRHWLHALPRTARPLGPRLNLTFRWVRPADQTVGVYSEF